MSKKIKIPIELAHSSDYPEDIDDNDDVCCATYITKYVEVDADELNKLSIKFTKILEDNEKRFLKENLELIYEEADAEEAT